MSMGAEGSKSSTSSGSVSYASTAVDFPNQCRKESEATAWTLLHQCVLDKWKEGHAGEQFHQSFASLFRFYEYGFEYNFRVHFHIFTPFEWS